MKLSRLQGMLWTGYETEGNVKFSSLRWNFLKYDNLLSPKAKTKQFSVETNSQKKKIEEKTPQCHTGIMSNSIHFYMA